MKRDILIKLAKEINEDLKEKDIFVKILSEGIEETGECIQILLFKRIGILLKSKSATIFIHNNLDMGNKTNYKIIKKIILDQIKRVNLK